MIVITLTIRPTDSMLWLTLVRHRLGRFDSVKLDANQSILWMPGVGSILLEDKPHELRLQAVAKNEAAAIAFRGGLNEEINAAVPESAGIGPLKVDWAYPGIVPIALRA